MIYNPQLETFIRVTDSGSFSKAAEELFITPTAVIKQINTLESELDVQLFVRTHRGIALTESGKSFYKDAKHLIKYAKDSIVRAKRATKDGESIIRIGTSPMTPTTFLVEIWPRSLFDHFHRRAPFCRAAKDENRARDILRSDHGRNRCLNSCA